MYNRFSQWKLCFFRRSLSLPEGRCGKLMVFLWEPIYIHNLHRIPTNGRFRSKHHLWRDQVWYFNTSHPQFVGSVRVLTSPPTKQKKTYPLSQNIIINKVIRQIQKVPWVTSQAKTFSGCDLLKKPPLLKAMFLHFVSAIRYIYLKVNVSNLLEPIWPSEFPAQSWHISAKTLHFNVGIAIVNHPPNHHK